MSVDMSDIKPAMTPEQERLLTEINDDFEDFHADVNRSLRIKRMPLIPGFRLRDLDKYAAFLDSGPAEQAKFLEDVHPDEAEFFAQLLMSRIDFEIAEEKSGSITDEKVARYPDRYDWKP
ncbi:MULTISPECIES: hypothetical protein [Agrobacterium]|uniref:Uncharacterized protein n=2 Tax=Agrobacterium salinitolerans TaxID=1183413 RepID=A0ABY3BUU2_9HYPH|nr:MULTISPECIES: hypothetical protein [Agrobacterium]TRA96870.1 hypothetical protein EXN23_01115 [Agrobacterium salinitolerans]